MSTSSLESDVGARGQFSGLKPAKSTIPSYWIVGTVFLIVLTWIIASFQSRETAQAPPIHVALPLPESVWYGYPSWSPDGTRLLLTAKDAYSESSYIVEYDFSSGITRELTDKDGSYGAVYSPDGQLFYSGRPGNRLVSESIAGGSETLISENYSWGRMAWEDENRLLYMYLWRGLGRIDVNDLSDDSLLIEHAFGTWNPVKAPQDEIAFFGAFLRGEMNFITKAVDLKTGILVESLTSDLRQMPRAVTNNGFLISMPFVRGPLSIRPINFKTRTFAGPRIDLFDVAQVAVSSQGHIAYSAPTYTDPIPDGENIYLINKSTSASFLSSPQSLGVGLANDFIFSPDGDQYVIESNGLELVTLSTGSLRTLVSGDSRMSPFWSGNGRHVYYSVAEDTSRSIFRIRPDGSGEEAVVQTEKYETWPSVDDNETVLAFMRQSPTTNWDVWIKDLESGNETALLDGNGGERYPMISPDGKWLAAVNESDGRLIVVSVDGQHRTTIEENSAFPRWSFDGRFLYYQKQGPHRIIRRSFDGDTSGLTIAERIGEGENVRSFQAHHIHWSPHPSGGVGVAMVGLIEELYAGKWHVIFNWAATLKNLSE